MKGLLMFRLAGAAAGAEHQQHCGDLPIRDPPGPWTRSATAPALAPRSRASR